MPVLVDHNLRKDGVEALQIFSDRLEQVLEAEAEQSEHLVHDLQVLHVDCLDDCRHDLLLEVSVDVLPQVLDKGNQQLEYLALDNGVMGLHGSTGL